MPLFGGKKDLTDPNWVRKHVIVDPSVRTLLEDMYESDIGRSAGMEKDLFVKIMSLIWDKFISDTLLENLPSVELRRKCTEIEARGTKQQMLAFMFQHIPDLDLLLQQAYLDFRSGGFQAYEVHKDAIYRVPGK